MEDQPAPGPPPSSSDVSLCPHRGLRLAPVPDTITLASIARLGMLALLMGGLGTCSLLACVPWLLSPRGGKMFLLPMLLFGAMTSHLAILCAKRILESVRARREKP